ncbi:aspartyl protease family protein [Cohaesibacter sp. ES.047]|uniref:retropepsin-like aspartic protease family protein n=1 Tax=Cohaesibacter sp. ES.047 TaxID=1798205 RepID=UPI000BC094DC|nr:TIGR02281 family clan AA aspartic protease [Cohaesibacter sp. ES.047]SNY91814.1 aspartyl protease family protein [Cohaesibacter sp. ES.047]
MARLIFLAILAIGVFSVIPPLAQKWAVENGYMEPGGTSDPSAYVSTKEPAKKVRRSGRAVLRADSSGHYVVKAYINNRPIRVVIDTGATVVALTYEDAKSLGLYPKKSDFTVPVNTANGRMYNARAQLQSVRIGEAEERNIKAIIAPKGALGISLMGMSYLKKLKSFRFSNGKLILES